MEYGSQKKASFSEELKICAVLRLSASVLSLELIHYDEDAALFQEAQIPGHVPHSLGIGMLMTKSHPPVPTLSRP